LLPKTSKGLFYEKGAMGRGFVYHFFDPLKTNVKDSDDYFLIAPKQLK